MSCVYFKEWLRQKNAAGGKMRLKANLMDEAAVGRALSRIAHEIL